MARFKFARSLVAALMFVVMVIAAVNAQPTGFPPTDPQQPPTLQNRGIIWGD